MDVKQRGQLRWFDHVLPSRPNDSSQVHQHDNSSFKEGQDKPKSTWKEVV